ncbi:MAG TPA: hypothetical protein VL200_12330 [Lacunisphaera sp.]|nr:hypothetical protein [Lacunisphaera sp.]
MIRQLLVGTMLCATAVFGGTKEGGFSGSINPADFQAAGLNRLTPAERQRLDELVAAYRNTAEEKVRRTAEADVKAAQAEAKAAQAATNAAKAEVQAAKAEAGETKRESRGFFAKARVEVVPGTMIEYAVIKSTILGKFEGWEGRKVFRLANGQQWQVMNAGESYYTRPTENMEVEIAPARMGGFWMNFPTLQTRVRVRLISEK